MWGAVVWLPPAFSVERPVGVSPVLGLSWIPQAVPVREQALLVREPSVERLPQAGRLLQAGQPVAVGQLLWEPLRLEVRVACQPTVPGADLHGHAAAGTADE